MLIKQINLTNFRNHSAYHLECNPDTTLILGENGCGKTSVLEAIYILTRGKSFRATDPDIVKRGADFYHIELEYNTGVITKATYDGNLKTFESAGKKSRRLPKKQKYPIILFEPQDLNLITGSPSRHRDYFDRIFSELSDDYASALTKYNKAIKQRNELLKSLYVTPDQLFSWNFLLAKFGTELHRLRTNFTREIDEILNPTYHSIANTPDVIHLNYLSHPSLTEHSYLQNLESSIEKDRILGHTTFGVHHDDYQFIFNQQNASGSASRGESRSIIISLKFVEANIIEQILHKKPIVLLDDVFSELDATRRTALIQNFKNHQVILTSVESVDQNLL